MAAAAGRSLLLLLSSRGCGGGGAGGCGALTAGCFPGLGVSRHRQQQHHRTVSERARRLRGGRGGAGVWEPPAGRPPGQQASYLNSRPLPRLPGTEEPPCPSGACGGDQEGRAGGRKPRGGGGATAGMFPQDWGHQGGEGTGLEPLPDPPPISVPPFFVLYNPAPRLPNGARWKLSPFPPPLGGLGSPELPRPPCVCQESGSAMLLGAAPESSPGPQRGRPASSLVPEGSGKKENQTLSLSVTSCVCVCGGNQLPRDGCCIASGGKLHPLGFLKVLLGVLSRVTV